MVYDLAVCGEIPGMGWDGMGQACTVRGLALNGRRTSSFAWRKDSKGECILWIVGRRGGLLLLNPVLVKVAGSYMEIHD